MKFAKLALFLFAAALALTGCSTPTDRRIAADDDFKDKIAVVSVNTTTVGGDMLKVQVELQNKTKKIQRFVYNFEWFDSHGMLINNTLSTAMIPDQIDGQQSKFIYAVAPTPTCTDYHLRLMKAKSTGSDE